MHSPLNAALHLHLAILLGAIIAPSFARAAEAVPEKPLFEAPVVADASDEGERAISRFQVPPDWKVTLVAGEPEAANVVAFTFDEQGALYVAESFRQNKGVEDTRGHMDWRVDELAAETLEDRRKFFEKYFGNDIGKLTKYVDRIRRLTDTDGDGRYETSTEFATGFNDVLDGTGAGVLAYEGNVYYTCIPHLWRLEDLDGDGVSDIRRSLHYGYGVRVALRGHDSHGLILGPDGKVYFSIGDRGYHIELPDGRVLHHPDQGAVFRFNPDGSGLEEYATGLRNPQELAFDHYGRLFTGDNNSDGGDRARWVDVVEGGDSGWRMYYQHVEDRGPWNREFLWHPARADQPAYIVPPVLNLGDGPSGLTHDPGVGLSSKHEDMFFLADFRGSPGNSGIRGFRVKPRGASFEVVDAEQTIWSILATDVEFGYDGSIYVSDWVDGWEGINKGRIYRFSPPGREAVQATAELFRAGFTQRSTEELAGLLEHADYRVRQRAQFVLAQRGEAQPLLTAALSGKTTKTRVHGIWGVGQIATTKPEVCTGLLPLLDDEDAIVREQVAKVLGNSRFEAALDPLIARLDDADLRVQTEAAIALGKLTSKRAFEPVLQLLARVDAEPVLRHAAILGLLGSASPEELVELSRHSSPRVRLGAVVALRRLNDPRVSAYLNDADPAVLSEAAIAIHDRDLTSAMPALAELIARHDLPDQVIRRAISANFQLGTVEHAQAVLALATDAEAPEQSRRLALEAIRDWNAPSPIDRVTGDYQPLAKRSLDLAPLLRDGLPSLLSASAEIRGMASKLAADAGVTEVEPYLVTTITATDAEPSMRAAALLSLRELGSDKLGEMIDVALASDVAGLRSAGRSLLAQVDPAKATTAVRGVLSSGEISEQQAAMDLLAKLKGEEAEALLLEQLQHLLDGAAAREIQLDILEAAKARGGERLQPLLERYSSEVEPNAPWKKYSPAFVGGEAERGKRIFFERSEVSCRRCHRIAGNGGEVGPDLTKIALTQPREYLMDAIVDPNKHIAKGFETIVCALDDGRVIAGIVKENSEETLQLVQPTGEVITVNKSEIEEQAAGKSGMPEDLVTKISVRELRDLIEYLSTLKGQDASGEHGGERGH